MADITTQAGFTPDPMASPGEPLSRYEKIVHAPVSSREIMLRAVCSGLVVPAFNVPYQPMMEPIVDVLRDARVFGLIQVARLEWMKFSSGSLQAIRDTYEG